MKAAALLVAAVLSIAAVADADNCAATCNTRLLSLAEADCRSWRDELPRPQLFNHCKQGYKQGRVAGCAAHCGKQADTRRLESLGIDACQEHRARPPVERMTACAEGFQQAVARALEYADKRRLSESNDDTPAKPAKPNKPEEPKRKLSVNTGSSTTKNVLEAAREEAVLAFQEAKGGDL